MILCVRQLYDGYRQIRPTEAFLRITAPYRSGAFYRGMERRIRISDCREGSGSVIEHHQEHDLMLTRDVLALGPQFTTE